MSTRKQPTETQRSVSIACSLESADLAHRQERWLKLGQRAGVGAATTSNGLELLFRSAPDVEEELRQLAALERDCCPFAAWSLKDRGEELALDVTAYTDEGVPAVQAMFAELRSTLDATSN